MSDLASLLPQMVTSFFTVMRRRKAKRRNAKGKRKEERGEDGASITEIRTHGSVGKQRASAFNCYSFQLCRIKLQPQAAIFNRNPSPSLSYDSLVFRTEMWV